MSNTCQALAFGVSKVTFTVRAEPPFVIENATADRGLLVRQAGGGGGQAGGGAGGGADNLSPWTQVLPCSSTPFAWERPMAGGY